MIMGDDENDDENNDDDDDEIWDIWAPLAFETQMTGVGG
jgi:hypothetical protein